MVIKKYPYEFGKSSLRNFAFARLFVHSPQHNNVFSSFR